MVRSESAVGPGGREVLSIMVSCRSLLFGLVAMPLLCSRAVLGAETPAEQTDNASVRIQKGTGLDIRSADGDFQLKIKVFGQLQYAVTGGAGATAKGDSRDVQRFEQSFAVRRARLYFSGYLFGEHNKYSIQLAFSPQDMGFKNGGPTKSPIFDWYFRFDYLRDLTLQVGQYRIPFNKSRVIPYAKLQFIDRTAANFEFNLDRDIGIDVRSADVLGLNLLRYYAGVFIGEGRDGYSPSDFGLVYVARLELHPLGLFSDYLEADLERSESPRLAFGAAYAFLHDAKYSRGITGGVPADGGTSDLHVVTADLAFKFRGFSLLSEFYYRQSNRDFGNVQMLDENGDPIFEDDGVTPVVDREQGRIGLGWFSQIGWMLPGIPLEIAGRYGQVHPHGSESPIRRLDEFGLAVNWYIFGPSMALKTDYHRRFFDGEIEQSTDEIRLSFQAGF